MDYHDSITYLESLQQSQPKLGIETTDKVLSELDNPQNDIDCVQIAGSNGKGSTARMLECILREGGYDVGLYTSPDLNGLRERIRVNGQKIPEDRIRDFASKIYSYVNHLSTIDETPTYFEVLTALALQYFGAKDVDVAVLEVGIGGQADATSAVDPIASAVTSVTLEHTDILGDTIEEIACDKAQVAPNDAPLVTGAKHTALEAIQSETEVITVGTDDEYVTARESEFVSRNKSAVSIATPEWSIQTEIPLPGQHQATNAGIAAMLARQIASVPPETISEGLRNAHWPGRFEIMSVEPLVILDGAHNPGACAALRPLIDRYEFDTLHLVFGALSDKDHGQMAAELSPIDTLYLCEPGVSRAENVETLATAFDEQATIINRDPPVLEATKRALSAADRDDCVLVTGSLYAVSEARNQWT